MQVDGFLLVDDEYNAGVIGYRFAEVFDHVWPQRWDFEECGN